LRARFIVRGGARWCIGAGSSILILDEPWMQNGRCIDGNIFGAPLLQNYTVNSMIDTTHQRWNASLVHQIFSKDITIEILNTLLISQVTYDRLVWKAKNNVFYYVRCA
jgi:hypothetical protein